jgi:hypothetical protein
MKAASSTDASKVFILKQGVDGTPVGAAVCRTAGLVRHPSSMRGHPILDFGV